MADARLWTVSVRQRESLAPLGGDRLEQHRAAQGAIGGVDHLLGLLAESALENGGAIGAQRRLVNVELVGVDGALNHRFAQPVAGGDEHRIAEAGFGVHGEHHARCALVGAHHALDAGRQRHDRMLEAVMHAVGDGAVVEQAGEHFLDGLEHVVDAVDIEEGFLLAGEAGVGQVFCRGRGAHGHRNGRTCRFVDQGLVGGANLRFQGGGEGRLHDRAADLLADLGKPQHIVNIKAVEQALDARVQALVGQKHPVCRRGGGKAVGHFHAGFGELADHFAEAGVLAAHGFDVVHAKRGVPKDLRLVAHRFGCSIWGAGRDYRKRGVWLQHRADCRTLRASLHRSPHEHAAIRFLPVRWDRDHR